MLHRRHYGHRMRVVRRGNEHCVDLPAQLIQHPPEILEHLRLWILLERVRGVGVIDVAERDDVLAETGDVVHVTAALAADADASHVEFVIGGSGKGQSTVAQDQQTGAAEGGVAKEAASGRERVHGSRIQS